MEKKYSKNEAIESAKEFIKKVNALEKAYGIKFNSDTGDIYLSYKLKEGDRIWDSVKIGWAGDGSGLKVTEIVKDSDYYKQQAISKLSKEEIEALGL